MVAIQKIFTLALAALASIASAAPNPQQDIIVDGIRVPGCAVGCIRDATLKYSNCDVDDLRCRCNKQNRPKITQHATPCVIDKCGMTKAIKEVQPACDAICKKNS